MGDRGAAGRGIVAGWIARLGLRYPVLFLLFAVLFVADVLIPDLIPFVDELGLGLLTALFGAWRGRRRSEPSGPAREGK